MQITLTEKIENFSQLPDQECASIIQKYFLEALLSESYIDWDIVTKFINTPYADRETLCKLFNSAIKKNIQQIAGVPISDWIKKYQDRYLGKERNPDSFFEYVNNSPEIKRMPKRDQLLLARTLRIYDYLLVIPIIDLDGPVSNILRFAMRTETTPGETTERAIERKIVKMKIENLPIDTATERYPELGEQLITSNHIKLKIFPEPVRPSIKNWLSDYTFTVGISNHDPIVRGNYLFKGENARNLSQEDRAKLTAILKSFEEKTPLAVNVNTRQVVFSAPEKKVVRELSERPRFNQNISRNNFPSAETSRAENSYYPTQKVTQSQPRFQTDEERISAWRRNLPQKEDLEEKPVASNVHFSSPQIFSTEKPPETTRPIQPNYAQKAPIARINYSTPRPMPKNVVDLREE